MATRTKPGARHAHAPSSRSTEKDRDIPKVKFRYWPHAVNVERLSRSRLDWRLLCPGPMVDEPALGLDRLRISTDTLPVYVPAFTRALPGPLFLPVFSSLIPEMFVPFAMRRSSAGMPAGC